MNRALSINDLNVSKVPLFSKIVTFLLLLDSVLNTYGTAATSISSICQTICIIIYIISYAIKRNLLTQITNVPRWIIWYLVYLIIISFIKELSIPIGYIKIILWYIVFFNVLDVRYLLKSYKNLAILVIVFFYIQEITYFVTGIRILGFIPGLPIRLEAAANDLGGYLAGIATNTRSSSIFSEPAHLAQWLFPLLCIHLFSNKYKSLVKASIIALTLLLTKSGNAMFGLGALGFFYIFYNFFKSGNITTIIKGIAFVVVGIIALFLYANSSIGSEVLERQETLSVTNEMDKGYATSSFMRIYRGYFIYADYNLKEKIFGNPSSDAFWQHAYNSGIASLFKENDTYLNTVHRILIYTGIIGALLIIMLIANLWKDNSWVARSILILWVVFSFISSGFFTGYTSIYLAFIYLFKTNKQI